MNNKIKQKNYHIFFVLPLVVFLIYPDIQDANGIPKLIALISGTWILVTSRISNLSINKPVQYFPWLIVLGYTSIQAIKRNSIEEFFLGTYMRNGGFIALVCFSLIFTVTSNFQYDLIPQFLKIFKFTFYGLLAYGVVDNLGILPYEQINSYQNSVSLTLTNPNFASAYLGIALSVMPFLLSKGKYLRFLDLICISYGTFLLLGTNSLQGLLIILLNCSLYIIYFRDSISGVAKKYKKFLILVFFITGIFIVINLSKFIDWLYLNGSIRQRLNYWELVLHIFRDNWIFGLGLDNLANSITLYRNIEFIKQEGTFTIIDRSHNVVLDNFVNGGMLIGMLWLLFIIIICKKSLKLIRNKIPNESKSNKLVLIGIWLGYLIQSLISVDHLSLTLLGFISAGLIVAEPHTPKTKNLITNKISIYPIKIIISVFLIGSVFFGVHIWRFESWVYQVVQKSDYTRIQDIYKARWVPPRSFEKVAVKISNDKQYKLAYEFGGRLLELNPNSHQAFFMIAVYFESQNNLLKAKEYMLESLRLDKFNSVYLLSMALYENKLGDKVMALEYLNKTIEVDPNQQGIEYVSSEIAREN